MTQPEKRVSAPWEMPLGNSRNSWLRTVLTARLLRLFGRVALIIGSAGWFLGVIVSLYTPSTGMTLMVASMAVFWLGKKTTIFGRKLGSLSAHNLLTIDDRPPVLYLRSFSEDADTAKSHSTYIFSGSALTEEEQLARALIEIGPFIAVGRPGEQLPALGAARIYVGDDVWRETVTGLMRHARLVVIRVGKSDGLWWEVQAAVQSLPPEQLLFCIPRGGRRYELFRQQCSKLSIFLPPYPGDCPGNYSLGHLVYFDPGGRPHCSKIIQPFFRRNMKGPLVSAMKWTLRPVYEQLGVKWRPPRLGFMFHGSILILLGPMMVYINAFSGLSIPSIVGITLLFGVLGYALWLLSYMFY